MKSNNPMSCISNNISFVESYAQQLLEHISLQQQGHKQPAEVHQEQVAAHAESIELDYISEDLPSLVQSMKTSSDRIQDISQSLRIFARQDAYHKTAFDLHAGLNSTLLILKHRLKDQGHRTEVQVVKDYGPLPEVLCYPGQINQVLMNILANALDAFEEQPVKTPTITIQTKQQGDRAYIYIQDNAGGMPESVRSHIFDHAYTTKAVGKGTGLGLSIARQIVVERHGGQITCESTPGKGSQFTVALPIGK